MLSVLPFNRESFNHLTDKSLSTKSFLSIFDAVREVAFRSAVSYFHPPSRFLFLLCIALLFYSLDYQGLFSSQLQIPVLSFVATSPFSAYPILAVVH